MTSDDDLPRRKAAMRREVAARLTSLDPSELAKCGLRATRRLGETEDFRSAESLLLYSPMPDEIDISALIDDRLAAGKAVFFPLCARSAGRMRALRVLEAERDLASGRFGIMEPREDLEEADPLDLDFVLVPGRAFDRRCRRLGRGGGYYDRFLGPVLEEGGCAASVALDLQIFDQIPAGKHDLPVAMVCTESELIRPPAARTLITPAGE